MAFASTAAGTLPVSVENKSRRVREVDAPLALEERLAKLINDRIDPRLLARSVINGHRRQIGWMGQFMITKWVRL